MMMCVCVRGVGVLQAVMFPDLHKSLTNMLLLFFFFLGQIMMTVFLDQGC